LPFLDTPCPPTQHVLPVWFVTMSLSIAAFSDPFFYSLFLWEDFTLGFFLKFLPSLVTFLRVAPTPCLPIYFTLRFRAIDCRRLPSYCPPSLLISFLLAFVCAFHFSPRLSFHNYLLDSWYDRVSESIYFFFFLLVTLPLFLPLTDRYILTAHCSTVSLSLSLVFHTPSTYIEETG